MPGLANEAHSLFDVLTHSADSAPERIAVQHEGTDLSYGELRGRALAFGEHLRAAGIRPGDRLVLLLENSPEYVLALLGMYAAGIVAVPLNPDTDAKRLQYVSENCGARTVLIRRRRLETLGAEGLPQSLVFEQDTSENLTTYFGGHHPPSLAAGVTGAFPVDEANVAMVLYTSGTSGRPKGVMLSYRNLLANVRSIVQYLELSVQDSIVNVLPFFYSFGNSILLTHLTAGGRVVIENRFTFPGVFVNRMQEERPTGIAGVPSTYYILLNKTNFAERDWSFIRYISQAGGPMRTESIARLRSLMPRTRIFIMYGQTEATARLGYLPPDMLETKIGSIGKGIPGVELRVADERGQPTPPGKVGEILARGENIMIGYLEDPEATAQALRDGWLHTGDLAHTDDEGYIYVAGRKSDFIKSASYRISPGEIEEVIAEIDGVQDVAVIGIEDELLGEAIAACVSCEPHSYDVEALRRHCLARLPIYKVPKYFVHHLHIPYTSSGKLRYNLLREQYPNSTALRTGHA